ncbi:MAG: PEP-CTERM sorting domain-containing protein [Phycisphaerae bacterium]
MLKRAVVPVIAVALCALAVNLQAAPLSVNILDHDFTFHVPYSTDGEVPPSVSSAVYEHNGSAPDVLRLTDPNLVGEAAAGWHNVASYGYSGVLPQVSPSPGFSTPPGASPWLYPTFFTCQSGARLELEMHFDSNDGPYVNPAGDRFDISLTGGTGFLRITGWIGTQGWPTGILYPDPQPGGMPNDVVLLEIMFEQVSLLARAGHSTADLIEGAGQVTMAMGYTIEELSQMEQFYDMDADGVTFFKFMLPNMDSVLFPQLAAAPYDPLQDYGLQAAYGAISGEAGVGVYLPEPATLAMLAMGGLAVVTRRRRP